MQSNAIFGNNNSSVRGCSSVLVKITIETPYTCTQGDTSTPVWEAYKSDSMIQVKMAIYIVFMRLPFDLSLDALLKNKVISNPS